MTTRSAQDFQVDFLAMLSLVEQGEEVVIEQHGHPVAKLVRISVARGERQLGLLEGQIDLPEDFDSLDPAVEELFFAKNLEITS